jgi:hypothetical protein
MTNAIELAYIDDPVAFLQGVGYEELVYRDYALTGSDLSYSVIPKTELCDDCFYAVRLVLRGRSRLSYSDSIPVRTLGDSQVNVVVSTYNTTNSSISIAWDTPLHSVGILGYEVRLLVNTTLNSLLIDEASAWNVSQLTVVTSSRLPVSQRSLSFGCPALAQECLVSSTIYVVEITVLRETGLRDVSLKFIATRAASVQFVRKNEAQLYLHGGSLTLTFASAMPIVSVNTSAASTYLYPLLIVDANWDLDLGDSVVLSSTAFEVVLSLSQATYTEMLHYLQTDPSSLGLKVLFGNGSLEVPLTHSCLSLFFHLSLLTFRSEKSHLRRCVSFCGAIINPSARGLSVAVRSSRLCW